MSDKNWYGVASSEFWAEKWHEVWASKSGEFTKADMIAWLQNYRQAVENVVYAEIAFEKDMEAFNRK